MPVGIQWVNTAGEHGAIDVRAHVQYHGTGPRAGAFRAMAILRRKRKRKSTRCNRRVVVIPAAAALCEGRFSGASKRGEDGMDRCTEPPAVAEDTEAYSRDLRFNIRAAMS